MGQHAEGVPFAAGEDHLGIDEGGTRLGQAVAVAQHSGSAASARLLLLHQRQRLAAGQHVSADQRRGKRFESDALSPINHIERQVLIAQTGDKGGELAAQRHGGVLSGPIGLRPGLSRGVRRTRDERGGADSGSARRQELSPAQPLWLAAVLVRREIGHGFLRPTTP